jgi:hypothetical protein
LLRPETGAGLETQSVTRRGRALAVAMAGKLPSWKMAPLRNKKGPAQQAGLLVEKPIYR